MNELAEMIERVVREVLASLGHTVIAAPAVAPSCPTQAKPQPSAQPDDAESLVLDRRVVTLADLPERIKTVRRVVVPRGAVVTPAVKDELRQRKIALIVGQGKPAPVEAAKAILMVAASTYDAAPLAVAFRREGLAVEPRRMDCLIRATDALAADVKSGSIVGVVATGYTAAAMCLANRHAGLRAILGVRADAVAADAASVGANVLVVDPAALGFWGLKQMVSQFLRSGPRPCPEVFQKQLG